MNDAIDESHWALLPSCLAIEFGVFPIGFDGETMVLASKEGSEIDEEWLSFLIDCPIELRRGVQDVEGLIHKYYSASDSTSGRPVDRLTRAVILVTDEPRPFIHAFQVSDVRIHYAADAIRAARKVAETGAQEVYLDAEIAGGIDAAWRALHEAGVDRLVDIRIVSASAPAQSSWMAHGHRESEARLRELTYIQTAMSAFEGGVWLYDFSERTAWFSPQLAKLLGLESNVLQCSLTSFAELLCCKQDLNAMIHAIGSSLSDAERSGGSRRYDVRHQMSLANEQSTWVRTYGQLFYSTGDMRTPAKKEFIGGMTLLQADSEVLLNFAADLIENCFLFIKDKDLRFVYVNQALASAVGKPRDAIVGKRDAEVFPNCGEVEFFNEKDQEAFRLLRENKNNSSARLVIDRETLTDDQGKVRCLSTVKQAVEMPGGGTYLVGIATDVGHQKQWEQALRTTLVQHPHPAWIVDGSYKILACSSAFSEGENALSVEAVIGTSISQFYEEREIKAFRAAVEAARHQARTDTSRATVTSEATGADFGSIAASGCTTIFCDWKDDLVLILWTSHSDSGLSGPLVSSRLNDIIDEVKPLLAIKAITVPPI